MKKNKRSSRAKLRIKGLNQERALNSLSKDFDIFNIDRADRRFCEFEVESKNAKKVKSALAAQGFEVEIISSRGLSHWLKIALGSYGIITALILSTIFYVAQYGQIWLVKVVGTQTLDKGEIVTFIDDNFSRSKSKLDTKDMEDALKKQFFKISSVSVAVVGQSLLVNIYEKTLPPEMQGQFSPIFSDFDGRITAVELVQGTLAVKPGDIVQKGDILVQPFIVDSQGQMREVEPAAKIHANVWLRGESEHSESRMVTYRTGNKIVCDEISLFGLKIYSNAKEITFSSFDLEKSETYLTKNNILPLILQKNIYYETKTEQIDQSFEEVKEQKIDEAKQNALIYLQECDIIESEDYVISGGSGNYTVTYLVTVNRSIGVTYEGLF